MSDIKVLDCTLRDGGYVNDWNFGIKKSKSIVHLLQKSNIDYIEIGFIQKEPKLKERTIFNNFSDIKKILPLNADKNKLTAMIAYGKFDIDLIPNVKKTSIKTLRVILKKNQIVPALEYCKKIKEKGYKLFINPTFVDQYSDNELIELINKVNEINPYAFGLIDSMGVLKEEDVLRFFNIIDKNLNENIALCFHSHNNLQLSFSNTKCIIKSCQKRELIIDSTVFGIGRGAGNLCSEFLLKYINDNLKGNYNIFPILKIIDKYINPIFLKNPWGYSYPYYLSAINRCHPNYVKYLIDKTVNIENIDKLLKFIPNDKKANYEADLIEKICKKEML